MNGEKKMKYFSQSEINNASFGTDKGFNFMSDRALLMFDKLREACGFPLIGTCFYRTVKHDRSKGRTGNSQHCKGLAVDFKYTNMAQAVRIIAEAGKLGFTGIAINEKKKFVHLDIRESKQIKSWEY